MKSYLSILLLGLSVLMVGILLSACDSTGLSGSDNTAGGTGETENWIYTGTWYGIDWKLAWTD